MSGRNAVVRNAFERGCQEISVFFSFWAPIGGALLENAVVREPNFEVLHNASQPRYNVNEELTHALDCSQEIVDTVRRRNYDGDEGIGRHVRRNR